MPGPRRSCTTFSVLCAKGKNCMSIIAKLALRGTSTLPWRGGRAVTSGRGASGRGASAHRLPQGQTRPRFVGPFLDFLVVEQISLVSFRIKLPQSKIGSGLHDVFHVRNLLVDKPNAKSILPPEKFESTLNEQEYEMHSVITHDKHGKQNRFLIRWKNWPEALATWISEAVFRADAPDMLAEYIPTAPVPRPRASSHPVAPCCIQTHSLFLKSIVD